MSRNFTGRFKSPALALTALLLAGVFTGCGPGNVTALGGLSTVRVDRSTMEVELNEIGLVDATRVVSLIAPFRGKLISLSNSGDMVKKGDEVLVMEDEEDVSEIQDHLTNLQTEKAALEASIDSLKIALRSGSLDADFAESELAYERAKLEDVNTQLAETSLLLDHDVVPAEDLRSAQSEVDSSRFSTIGKDLDLRTQAVDYASGRATSLDEIDLHVLEANRARRELDEAQARIAAARVLAPVNGMFLRKQSFNRNAMRMSEPRPGDAVREGQIIAEIPDLDSLVLKTQIPEGSVGRVNEGDPVHVKFDAYEGLMLHGKVQSIGKIAIEREASAAGALVQADSYSGQKVFEVMVSFDKPDPRIRPGITAQAAIVLDRFENVLVVPVESVKWEDGKAYVGVVSKADQYERREVKLGERSGSRVIVTSGLNPGETIVSRWTIDSAAASRLPAG